MSELKPSGELFNPEAIEESVPNVTWESATEQVRQQIGLIRHLETGELTTILISVISGSHMKGATQLLAFAWQ